MDSSCANPRRSCSRSRWGAAVVTCLFAVAAQAAPEVSLRYARDPKLPTACPDELELREGVAAKLGRDPFGEPTSRLLTVSLRVERAELVATLTLVELPERLLGERKLRAKPEGCRELAEAMELAIALAIDPLFSAPGPSPANGGVSEPTLEPAAPPPPPEVNAPPDPPPPPETASHASPAPPPEAPDARAGGDSAPLEPLATFARFAVGAGLGASADVGLAAGVGAGLRPRGQSYGVELRAHWPSSRQLAGGAVQSTLVLANLVPCLSGPLVHGCVTVQGGALLHEATNLPDARSTATAWVAAGVRGELELPLGGGVLVGVLEITRPLLKTRVRVDPVQVLETPALAGWLALGYGGRW